MYETRLQDPALSLQGFQDLRNGMLLKVLEGLLKLADRGQNDPFIVRRIGPEAS
jgi:hypothetical protein